MGRPPSTGCHFNLLLLFFLVVVIIVVVLFIIVVVLLPVIVVAPRTIHFKVLVVFIIIVVAINCSGRRSKLSCEFRGRIFWAHRGAPRACTNHRSSNVACHIGFR